MPHIILIAEKDETERWIDEQVFSSYDDQVQVKFVVNGQDLFDYLNHHGAFTDKAKYPEPRFIMLDDILPDMNGLDVLKKLKTNESLKHIPVVIFSQQKSTENRDAFMKSGADYFLEKPQDVSEHVLSLKSLIKFWCIDC